MCQKTILFFYRIIYLPINNSILPEIFHPPLSPSRRLTISTAADSGLNQLKLNLVLAVL